MSNTRTPIPTFILKTYQMLEDNAHADVVQWTSQGTAFIVYNQQHLERQVLQNYFKHSNYSSFVRQLNLYNFKKIRSNEGQIFKHKFFRKGMKQMLQFIKRRNQEEAPTAQIQEEPSNTLQQLAIQIKEEQNMFKECALDIKETNSKLREDMKLLQETSSYLIDQMQTLNQFVYNQSVDIEVKFKQVGQMLHAINEELRQESTDMGEALDKSDATNKYTGDPNFQYYPGKSEDQYEQSKMGSPNPYVDYNPIPYTAAEYECFINSFR